MRHFDMWLQLVSGIVSKDQRWRCSPLAGLERAEAVEMDDEHPDSENDEEEGGEGSVLTNRFGI